ncbi:hypothetical protein K7X08_029912 [Anisodus acutangulus]|uniref:Protein kinase domain-containing protein n=1 Tax=Anisodus acutangulus TaxID=402998 RepID=A0A9Q1R520_9SOLA|nr:hypothetical protein K7X08_029912 [Anisodus acutangulus]
MGGGKKSSYSLNHEDYKLLEEVGYGASATVYRTIYLPSNEVVAVKCLDLDRCNSNLLDRFPVTLQAIACYKSGIKG